MAKTTSDLMGPAHAVNATDLAVRKAMANRAPAHLAIPVDIQSQTEDANSPKNPPGHTSLASQAEVPAPPREQLRRAADVLAECERVVILAGAGARGAGELVEQAGETLKPAHANKIVAAYEAGEQDRSKMARNLLEPGRVRLSPAVQQVQDQLQRYT